MRKVILTTAALLAALAPTAQAEQATANLNPALDAPVSHLLPGATPLGPGAKNPLAGDAQAQTRGMRDFINFNCVGCHAPNAGGGMGPSLSNNKWIYGDTASQIFLSIYQGRPNGMPAWGRALPENVIWELVSYIQSITEPTGKTFGKTISRSPQSPDKEQVPAENVQTTTPWKFIESFANGQKPSGE